MVLAVAVIAQLSAVMIVWSRGSDGWAFIGVMAVVAAVVVLLFGSLYPNLVPSTLNPDWSLTDLQRVVDPLHAEDHDLGGVDLRAAGHGVPGLDVLGVPETNHRRPDSRADRAVSAVAMNLWRASGAMRRYLVASVVCGVVITGATIASSVVLAHIVAGIITDPASRTLAHWARPVVDLAVAVGRSHAGALGAGQAVSARRDRGDRRSRRPACCTASPRCRRGSWLPNAIRLRR